MNYYDRYLNGEYEQVWVELQSLRSAVRQENHFESICESKFIEPPGKDCTPDDIGLVGKVD